jgi:hypothetical protein
LFSYDTTLPDDTGVAFFVQTPSMPSPLQVVSLADTDPPVCWIGSGTGCPVDLNALSFSSGAASTELFGPTITVSATLTGLAVVNRWEVRYSCVPNV